MKIQNLFKKDLFRHINGVVKADQQDETIIWQELNEYVVTKELDHHFRRFFETYLNAIQNRHDPNVTSRMGVWVSGFFGSGKSHFLKILSYLLNNRQAHNPDSTETRKATEFFDSKIKDPMLLADIKRCTAGDTDVILFNIDSRADSREGQGTILKVFWRVFNEMQGFSGDDPHIAEMERYLTAKGKFETFCSHYQELTGDDWTKERDTYHFRMDEVVDALSKTLEQSRESAERWFESADKTLNLTIDNFAKRVKEYLDARGENHRVIFLVDEIGQFIGNTGHHMLNLQTITEDLGRICQGRAWVVVTSQEDIDAVLGDLKASKANDFSKIQGRFNTRLSLSSSNTDEVIQARLLEKTKDAAAELGQLFDSKGDILKNQLSFTHDSASLKTYKNKQDFVSNYPFAPYHFQLVQKIFECIRKAGATGMHLSRGERSMLDAFQSAATNIADKPTGALVPLHEFYPAIKDFLDTAVKRTIEQAGDNDGLDKPFDVHLLETLFLIRYVDIIKPNVDNLVTLFIDQIDADRLSLKRKIEDGLQRLEKETLISRNGDLYFFLTNEERDVSQEIKNVDITGSEEVRLLADVIYTEILKDQTKHKYKAYKNDYPFSRLVDGLPVGGKVDQQIGVEILTPLHDEYSLFENTKCIMYTSEHSDRALFKLADNKELTTEVRIYLQTDKFIKQKSDSSLPTSFKRIIGDRQDENRERFKRITTLAEKLILDAEVYAMGQTLQISANSPRVAIENALDYVVQNLFNKFGYLKTLSDDPSREIRAVLQSTDPGQLELIKGLTTLNPDAIREVREYIDLMIRSNHPALLNELVDQFARKPYGWPEFEVVLLVARLFVAGELSLLVEGSGLEPREAVDPLTKTAKWKTVKILKRKVPSQEQIDKARKLCQDLFGKMGPENTSDLEKTIRGELKAWQHSLQQYKTLADTKNYPGEREIKDGLEAIRRVLDIRDTFEFFNAFHERRGDLLDSSEDIHTLVDFYTNQRPIWERLRSSLDLFSKNQAILIKDDIAGPALAQLRNIAAAQAPYSMLKDVDSLINKATEINDRLITEHRNAAITVIDDKIGKVNSELDKMQADGDFRNQVLYPLQQIKQQVAADTSIPDMAYQQTVFEQALTEALDKIEQKKEPQKKGETPPKVKPVKNVKASSIGSKMYLETTEDVETYVGDLKAKLLEELKEDVRIRIQ